MNFSENLLPEEIKEVLPEFKAQVSQSETALRPYTGDVGRSLREQMQNFKMEVAEEIGLDAIKDGTDLGLLPPTAFGHLGGQMSRRLTLRGKEIYGRLKNGQ